MTTKTETETASFMFKFLNRKQLKKEEKFMNLSETDCPILTLKLKAKILLSSFPEIKKPKDKKDLILLLAQL
jgi:hypothetical protein